MAVQTLSDLDFIDDAYFSATLDDEEENPQQLTAAPEFQVSDEKYANGLQFQEALMSSVVTSHFNKSSAPPSILVTQPPPNPDLKPLEVLQSGGESSKAFCEICAERRENDDMFAIGGCSHSFCSDCVGKHVAVRIQEGAGRVNCPGMDCAAVLDLDFCRPRLERRVVERWEEALSEAVISAAERFYCPFKECSAMLVDDGEGEVIRESECPFCHRLFCAQCRVPWHSGIDCEGFRRLNEDERGREDLMVIELADVQKWGRCPQCKFYVERTEGCPHMTCRCKFQFCYGCGSEWSSNHGGCYRK